MTTESVDIRADRVYRCREGGVLRPYVTPERFMPCTCSGCVAHRAAIRQAALDSVVLTMRGWAARAWDGPCAHFPGRQSDDGGKLRVAVERRRHMRTPVP